MYEARISPNVLQELQAASKISGSILTRIEELAVNPLAKAVPTDLPAIGGYYVNAGRYCILIDVDEESKIVTILAVRNSSLIYEILKGRVEPERIESTQVKSKAS